MFKSLQQAAADPAVTSKFLNEIDGVVNASVWVRGSTMMARVTVTDDMDLSESDLQIACKVAIGEHNTPIAILLDRRMRRAA